MTFWNVNEDLYNWLLENEGELVQEKIERIRKALGNGNSFTLLQYELDNDVIVQMNIGVDDYEDDDNREQVNFQIEVDTRYEEGFKNLQTAVAYFNKRIAEQGL